MVINGLKDVDAGIVRSGLYRRLSDHPQPQRQNDLKESAPPPSDGGNNRPPGNSSVLL